MKIAVLVSGGVDSAVALRLLKKQGHDVTAFYLKIWLEDELSFLGECPWQEDLAFVREICKQAHVPLEVLPLQKEYWENVVSYTIAEVRAGRTPNPDILCNKRVKFGVFYDAISAAFERVATGHYAQIEQNDSGIVLRQSPDPVKDQTYFLSQMSGDQLQRALFPIGHLEKSQVREHASSFDLPNKDRKDSQGICFLGKIKFNDFIRHYLGEQVGPIVDFDTQQVLGEHQGFWYHTIGQRRGSGLSGGPWYVVGKDPGRNIVYVSRAYYTADKPRREFEAGGLNWLVSRESVPGRLHVKLRHGPQTHEATVTSGGEKRIKVTLDARDQGIAPGQFAVFYQGNQCLGGGVIEKAL